jgi:hypothetical protein
MSNRPLASELIEASRFTELSGELSFIEIGSPGTVLVD